MNKILTFLIVFHLVGAPVAQAKNATANILMIGTAVAAPAVLMQCKTKPSAWIFLGTAGYFLASELFGSKKQKDDSGAILEEYKGKEASEKQIEALEAAADSAERAAQEGDKRSKRFKMVALGYAAAAAAALVEAYLAMPGSSPKPPGCIRPDTETGACTKGSCGGVGGAAAGAATGIGATQAGKAGDGLRGGAANPSKPLSWGGVTSMFSKAWGWIKKTIDSGITRGAVFGAMGAMALLASSGTKKDADTMRKQAKHYRDLAAKMRRRLGLEKGLSEGTIQYIPPVGGQATAPREESKEAFGGSCIVGAPGQFPQEDPTCACRKTNTCKKAALPQVDYPQFTGVASDLNEVGALIKKDADKVYSGDLAGAGNLSDATLSQAAAKVGNIKKRLWNLAEKKLNKQGGKKMNGALLEQAYGSRLRRAINSDFNRLSAAGKSQLAAISPAFVNGDPQPQQGGEKGKAASTANNNTLAGGGGINSAGNKGLGGMEFLAGDEKEEMVEEVPQEETGDPNKDIPDKAVHKGEERSIWDILSIRYLKSFFSR